MAALIRMPRAAWKRQPQGRVGLNPMFYDAVGQFGACIDFKNLTNIISSGEYLLIPSANAIQRTTPQGIGYQAVDANALIDLPMITDAFSYYYTYAFAFWLDQAVTSASSGSVLAFIKTDFIFGPHSAQLVNETFSIAGSSSFRTAITETLSAGFHTVVCNWDASSNYYRIFLDGGEPTIIKAANHASLQTNAAGSENFFHSSASPTYCTLLCAYIGVGRSLEATQARHLSSNPWQLFAPAPSRFYLIPSAGVAVPSLSSPFFTNRVPRVTLTY